MQETEVVLSVLREGDSRARGINRWRARCLESGHAGFGGRLPGKGPSSCEMSTGPRWAAHPTWKA